MALEDVDIIIDPEVVPEDVQAFLGEADERIDAFVADQSKRVPLGFVPSDFPRVYAALSTIVEQGLAPGSSLLEWGSGFGVVACMATWLDLDPHGIEIVPELVEASEKLAEDFELPAQFHLGSFVPSDGEELTDAVPDSHWLEAGRAAYTDIGLDIDDFDIVFAYPWPGEEGVTAALFERYGQDGALLVTYHGYEGIRVRRRVETAFSV